MTYNKEEFKRDLEDREVKFKTYCYEKFNRVNVLLAQHKVVNSLLEDRALFVRLVTMSYARKTAMGYWYQSCPIYFSNSISTDEYNETHDIMSEIRDEILDMHCPNYDMMLIKHHSKLAQEVLNFNGEMMKYEEKEFVSKLNLLDIVGYLQNTIKVYNELNVNSKIIADIQVKHKF